MPKVMDRRVGATTALDMPGEDELADVPVPRPRGRPPGRPLADSQGGGAKDRDSGSPSDLDAYGLEPEREVDVEAPRLEEDILADFEVMARVVYLGNNPNMSVPMTGDLQQWEDEEGGIHFRAVPRIDAMLTYTFNRFGSNRRPIKERMTKGGKMFAICRHIGHLAQFQRIRDADGAPLFTVRAVPEVTKKIEEYLARVKEVAGRNQDNGRPVLRAMGLL